MTNPGDAEAPAGLVDKITGLFADLSLSIGGLSQQMAGEMQRRARINANIMPLSVDLVGVTASATVDLPNILGPRTGWYWDVHTVICQNISGGTVTGYFGNSAGVQDFQFSSAGQINWGKWQNYLGAGERFVLVGSSGLSGTAAITLRGVQIAAPYLGDYLI